MCSSASTNTSTARSPTCSVSTRCSWACRSTIFCARAASRCSAASRRAGAADLRADFRDLPVASNSIDLLVLPHVLEFSADPHQMLREVQRVLMPEGHARDRRASIRGVCGGCAALFNRARGAYPWCGRFINLPRLKDWLALLELEIVAGRMGCYLPPCAQEKWIQRFRFMEAAGDRWWPIARRRLFPARRQARARHAHHHAEVARAGGAPAQPRGGAEGAEPATKRPPRATRLTRNERAMSESKRVVHVYTDGACKGNPGHRRLGRLAQVRRPRARTVRRRSAHHQQPHGNDWR